MHKAAVMHIDVEFNFYLETGGKDPDKYSPTLRRYHKILWSKQLPNGVLLDLQDNKKNAYLYHSSDLGEFFLGSDSIVNSYKYHRSKQDIIANFKKEAEYLFGKASTIGAYIIFPNNKIEDKPTINQERGINKFIDDRFDLTLECIRLFYLNKPSPLYDTLIRYKKFFQLFGNFYGYIEFFLLDDILDKNKKIKFFTTFDGFKTAHNFKSEDDYLTYVKRAANFVDARNRRIESYTAKI